ncbi:putative hydrolase of the HAD superfamily [Aquimarina sp. EL_43]|uniref:HAD family hydrolase n=1 Tax=unclassified Aquimarina TaxID=2627091 RepID=UPI0018CA48AD|nr:MULTISPECIES: HAD family hydrolase [unclassified Aquimarina]MBG6129364.1 putative hydrolase of the HAD superfamily [Aquimarina sp. EL_35]MBG6150429.1 putative hydrolase of the HAD superfamily [Aquimarina sp. EL_32]MBG6168263.1 putative hydrolase of the HAD superfamily [Aquimarina sp. EL_43]
MPLKKIKVIAFDADDTLWVNETFFRKAEEEFCTLLEEYLPKEEANKLLFDVEMQNLPLYGYGIKPFTLSLIEAAIKISNGDMTIDLVQRLIEKGKEMLREPIELIDGIDETLRRLSEKYRLVMATKGDLLDQERKLIKSGLENYFHHIEIVSDKTEKQYKKLVKHLDITENEFLMVGNSLKSDILPVLNIGAHAFHIPFHTTWAHEMVDDKIDHPNFRSFAKASELLQIL